ncbi:MAG: hypothetical protein ACLQSR_02985 [Limisphaerales bacterium]
MQFVLVAPYKRKNMAGEVLVSARAVIGVPLQTFTQFDEARLVVLCRTIFVIVAGQKKTVWLPGYDAMPNCARTGWMPAINPIVTIKKMNLVFVSAF